MCLFKRNFQRGEETGLGAVNSARVNIKRVDCFHHGTGASFGLPKVIWNDCRPRNQKPNTPKHEARRD